MLPDRVKKDLKRWVNQICVIGINSGKNDLKLMKKQFVGEIRKT